MPKIRDLGVNALPRYPAGGWRLQENPPTNPPGPCPSSSLLPCPGQSAQPCPGPSQQPCPGPSNRAPGGGQRRASGLSADAIAQLRLHLDHAVTNKFAR
jgi:hypothetical protein